jgi:hypothetical protein
VASGWAEDEVVVDDWKNPESLHRTGYLYTHVTS